MSAAKLVLPLDPARTDADWIDDITFYADDLDTPEDWSTASSASLAIVPIAPEFRATASFSLTSAEGGGLDLLANGVGIRVAALAMADRAPGTYSFELRRHVGAAITAELVGTLVVQQGLSAIADGEVSTGPVTVSGGVGGVKVIRGANGVRIVRDGGPQGDRGWSPVFASVVDGERRVRRLADWIGGRGIKPSVTGDDDAALYEGPDGLTTSLAEATDVRGAEGGQGDPGLSAYQVAVANEFEGNQAEWLASLVGAAGDRGWAPVTLIVAAGPRLVMQVIDWIGGTGAKPATGYVGPAGIVATSADAATVTVPAPAASAVSVSNTGLGLGGAIDVQAAISYLTKRSGLFQCEPQFLTRTRRAFRRVALGQGNATILFVGHSLIDGFKVDGVGATANANYANAAAKRWPTKFGAELARRTGLPVEVANVFGSGAATASASTNSNTGVPSIRKTGDPRLTYTAGSGYYTAAEKSLGGTVFGCNAATTPVFKLTSATAVDTVDIYYLQAVGLGTFNVSAGAGAAIGAATDCNGASALIKKTVALGSLAVQSANFARATGEVKLVGMVAYNNSVAHIKVLCAGWTGSKVTDWSDASQPWSPLPAVDVLAPDLLIVQLDLNEALAASPSLIPPSTYKTALTALMTGYKAQANGKDVGLAISGAPDLSLITGQTHSWLEYVAVEYEVAASLGLFAIDFSAGVNDSYAVAASLGFMVNVDPDRTHWLALGHADGAQLAVRPFASL